MDAPNPLKAAAIKIIVTMNLRFNKKEVDVGSYVLKAGSIKVEKLEAIQEATKNILNGINETLKKEYRLN